MGRNVQTIMKLQCENCGAPMRYDIIKQTYACGSCGQKDGVEDTLKQVSQWKALKRDARMVMPMQSSVMKCKGCGAAVLFEEGEASATCDFCNGTMVLSDLVTQEHVPAAVIPFVLTQEEAQQRLEQWAASHSMRKEAKKIKGIFNGSKEAVKGYYLPYHLIRGPISGTASRDLIGRTYHIDGFLDGTAVNASRQLDNLVLDGAEPFDWSALKDFQAGYIAGHRVKLMDMTTDMVEERVYQEAQRGYRPVISKALHGDDVEIRLTDSALLQIPVLLPMYLMRGKKFLAVVNGQTGKVSLSALSKPSSSKKWLIEPFLLTLTAFILWGLTFNWDLYAVTLGTFLSSIIIFSIYGDRRNSILFEKVITGKHANAQRKDGELQLQEDRKNAEGINRPAFYEIIHGEKVYVTPRFYTPWRIIKSVIQLFILVFLPGILALLLAPKGTRMHFEYGAAWYIVAGFYAFVYATNGLRVDIFNHPLLYTTVYDSTGKEHRKLVGNRKERKLSIFTMISQGETFSLRKMPKEGWLIIFFLLFMLAGSTMAIYM